MRMISFVILFPGVRTVGFAEMMRDEKVVLDVVQGQWEPGEAVF